jgi:Zn-dependent protease with chaperone function
LDERTSRPEFTGSAPRRVRRGVDASAVLSFVLLLPVIASSLIVMTLVGSVVWPQQPWVVPVVWVLSAGLVFLRPVESALSAVLLRMRRPTAAEAALLDPPWRSVCARARVDGGRYILRVENSTEINASAAGGRTVGVTLAALRLPPANLEAVLAHELGHHLSGHTVASILAWWYAIPARVATFVVLLGVRFVLFVGRIFAAFNAGLAAVATVLIALTMLTAVAFVNFWLILVPLISPLLAWASRLGEFRADQIAARLGYAPALMDVLQLWQQATSAGPRPGLRARLLTSHPSHDARIGRLLQTTARLR